MSPSATGCCCGARRQRDPGRDRRLPPRPGAGDAIRRARRARSRQRRAVFPLQAVERAAAGRWRSRTAGSAGCSTRLAGRWTGTGRCRPARVAGRVRAAPPEATLRARLGPRLDLGVRALNCFATCRQGQRLGLFSGSGIGKSTLLAMLARHTACDVAVLALVGERGREVREFLEDDLGEEDWPARSSSSPPRIAAADAPPGRVRRHDGGRAFPRPGQDRCCC